ncbi:CPBP family intramembrane metalloprotease [Fulvivirga sp. M361]|uniref:CPBP family intramembrane glutamic endopeptidase n=1 Tax=Fulvivirga sp. M361 TaxID=2594266 RepID=UPI001179DBD5|nr:CPBP family intramembrane glutamic endopeptidase [Fulvivirga sp. M361]TRX50945.1 CPBP family intramembrane metalloprotease [Fulvivirga sp. M361]
MDKFDNHFLLPEEHSPASSALLALLVSLISFFVVGPTIGLLLAIPFYDGSILEFAEGLSNPTASNTYKIPLFILQGAATLLGLFVIPAIYLRFREKITLSSLVAKPVSLLPWILTGIITITFMAVNAYFIEWNATITFPEFLSGFESWARKTEEAAALMTEYLTTFDNTSQFIIAFLVIAVFAALGEELVFRGILQNMLYKASGNIHLAIWLSAFLFSAIHFQFFGFIPRMLLGALFGYLYYWSSNLWMPVFAHFVNNGFTLVMVFLHNNGVVDFDIENSEAPSWPSVLLFTIITAGLLFYFRNHFLKKTYLK